MPNDVRSQMGEALRLDLVGPRTGHPTPYAEEVLPIAPSRSCPDNPSHPEQAYRARPATLPVTMPEGPKRAG
jgi:hypothetical protein